MFQRPGQRRSAVLVFVTLMLLASAAPVQAGPISWLENLARLGGKAGAVAVRVSRPARAAVRISEGIGLATAATMAFEHAGAVTGRAQMYLGLEGTVPRAVLRGTSTTLHDVPLGATPDLAALLRTVPDVGPSAPLLDLFVEEEIIAQGVLGNAILPADSHVYLANLHGKPWRIEPPTAGDPAYYAQVSESLKARIDRHGAVLDGLATLADARFVRDDVRVLSFFDAEGDLDTISAIGQAVRTLPESPRTAAPATLVRDVAWAKDKVLLAIGHVENEQMVLRRAAGQPSFAVDLARLEALAEQQNAVLVILGCETASPGRSGFGAVVNSLDIAKQLEGALGARNYQDFFAALGSPEVPLIIDGSTSDQAHFVISARLQRDRGPSAGATTVTSGRVATQAGRLAASPTAPLPAAAVVVLVGTGPVWLGLFLGWWWPARALYGLPLRLTKYVRRRR